MWIAVVTQKTTALAKEIFSSGHMAETQDEVARIGVQQARAMKHSYPSYTYRIVIGETTHEALLPEMRPEIIPLNTKMT